MINNHNIPKRTNEKYARFWELKSKWFPYASVLLKLLKAEIKVWHKSTRALTPPSLSPPEMLASAFPFDNIDNWAWKPVKNHFKKELDFQGEGTNTLASQVLHWLVSYSKISDDKTSS